MKKLFAFVLLMITAGHTWSQSLSIGSWQTHMAYAQAIDVFETKQHLTVVSNFGVFNLDTKDSSLTVLSKLDGLTEVEISCAAYDPQNDAVIIGYKNTNIDIIKSNTIINVNDILKKSIVGLKVINSIDVIDGIAYINCGFATVLYDIAKLEVKDTYYLGNNGSNLAVYNMAVLNGKLYAATDSGILEADYSNTNLANYQNWRKHSITDSIPTGKAATLMAVFAGKLAAYVNNKTLIYNGQVWRMPSVIYQGGAKRLMSDANHLLIVNEIGVTVYDANLLAVDIYTSPNYIPSVRAARYDKKGQLWIADFYQGLCKYDGVNKPYAATYVPNGPYNVSARRLAIKNGKLIVASGSVGDNYTNKFIRNGIYTYDQGVWRNYNYLNYSVMDSFYDFTSVVFDNKLNKEYYGTLWKGLLEFENNEFVKNYSYHNSTLGEALGNDGQYRVSGMAVDSKNQLWVANHWAEKPISVKKANGTWQNFEFPGVFGELKYVADITIDRNDQKWVVIPASNAILVFKESTNGKVVYKKLTAGQGAGNLPKDATEVFAITEDLDGRIWVGTNAGVVVFYNPSAILQFGADIDAQPVRVIDGEFVQYLLASETVTCIKVDGANRKWMGTKNGAWLFSDDGAQQIHYFNTSNSPLLANKINDIAINGENGIVYFATDNGIVSYRSDATKGYEVNLDQVKVFPNPVRENYEGIIAIQGLVNNAEVKITDINGKLVFRTFANGGQANWDGKNFAAEKVSTGVYLVLATDDFGLETMVKKILVIH